MGYTTVGDAITAGELMDELIKLGAQQMARVNMSLQGTSRYF
jgi:hypothetical protein